MCVGINSVHRVHAGKGGHSYSEYSFGKTGSGRGGPEPVRERSETRRYKTGQRACPG